MKIIATADLHINMHNRMDDTELTLKSMSDYAIKNNIDGVFIIGDIYDKKRPYNCERKLFQKFIKSLTSNNIKVSIIAGNHDTDKEGISALEEFKILDVKNACTYDNPSIVSLGKYKVFLGHMLVNGAIMSASDFNITSPVTVKHILENWKADLYLLGDVHKAQKLNSSPDMLYVGSPYIINFGERNDSKCFIEITDENNTLSYKPVTCYGRKMLQTDINNLDDYQTLISNEVDLADYKDAIVKVKINCTEDEYNNISDKEINKKLGLHAKNVSIEYDIVKEVRTRNSNITENCSISKAFTEYVKFKNFDNNILQLGLQIIDKDKE